MYGDDEEDIYESLTAKYTVVLKDFENDSIVISIQSHFFTVFLNCFSALSLHIFMRFRKMPPRIIIRRKISRSLQNMGGSPSSRVLGQSHQSLFLGDAPFLLVRITPHVREPFSVGNLDKL